MGSSELLPSTRALWRDLWRSPVAAVWIDSDVHPLRRLMLMVDQRERGELSAALASEIRQLEDRFGLNPVARRRLNWEIAAAREPERVAHLRAAPDDRDPRARLRDHFDPRSALTSDWSTT